MPSLILQKWQWNVGEKLYLMMSNHIILLFNQLIFMKIWNQQYSKKEMKLNEMETEEKLCLKTVLVLLKCFKENWTKKKVENLR